MFILCRTNKFFNLVWVRCLHVGHFSNLMHNKLVIVMKKIEVINYFQVIPTGNHLFVHHLTHRYVLRTKNLI